MAEAARMRKSILLVLALLVLVLPARAGDQDFQLFNRMGVDIYVSPAHEDDWGEDMLDGKQLIAGSDVMIVFSPDTSQQMWDIRVEDSEGNALMWKAVDLITAEQVVLEDNGVARIK